MKTQKLTVPNKLSEITLGQYQKFNKILGKDPDLDFLRKRQLRSLWSGACKCRSVKYTSIVEVTEIITKMFEEKPKLIQRFEKNGVEYGFIPVLTDMSFGEFVDLDTP